MYINILQSTAMSFQTCIDSGNHPYNQGIDVSSALKPPNYSLCNENTSPPNL